MGTKTGIGGFEIDGKNYTFDPTEPGTEGAPPVDATSVQSDVQVDESVRDLSDTTKEVLGDYLEDLTAENYYGVDGPTSPPTDSSLTTNEAGVPVPRVPQIGGHPNEEQFGKQFNEPENGLNLPVQPPDQITLGDRFGPNIMDPAEELLPSKGTFSRGKAYPQNPNGNRVLPKIGTDSTASPAIGGYVTKVLANNRFNEAARSTGANVPGITVDPANPGRGYNPTLRHPRYGDVSHHRLAQVGISLSIRASRELNATSDGNNPTSAGSEAGAILPTSNQLALTKVPLQNLRTSDILETLTGDEINEAQLKSITDGINDGSWGSLTNVHDQWTGITALGMIALSVALVAGVVVVFGVLGTIIGLISGGKTHPKTDDGRYTLGRYTITPNVSPSALDSLTQLPPDFAALLGLRQTTFGFGQALEVGTLAFFGIEGDSFTDLASLDGLDAAVTNPGWNAIVARTIVRSSTEIIDAFANIGGNPVSIAKGILNIIDVLRSSKLIAAMNTFANLGDQVLTIKEKYRATDLGGQIKHSEIDYHPDNVIAASVRKNRLKNSLKLAWANNRAPSSYLIPDGLYTFAAVAKKLGAIDTGLDTPDPKGKNFTHIIENSADTTGGRIPYDDDGDGVTVVKLEKLLEAEYMPFYFHDLRTNEIISFHAFITALTDDFAPAWEKSDGFGRVDQVRIYKNTVRTISLSFVVASTSPHDFVDMWTKINKLVTLVYPQYTPGRLLRDENGDFQFTQPFSQLIGASPLIRLRLGDLIRGNGSRFALARLFGADSGLMTLEGTPFEFFGGGTALRDLAKTVTEHTDPNGPINFDDTLRWVTSRTGLAKKKEESSISPPNPTGGGSDPEGSDVFNPNPTHLPYLQLKMVGLTLNGTAAIVKVELPTVQDLQEGYGMDPSTAGNLQADLLESYGAPADPDERLVDVEYVISRDGLILSPIAKKKFLDKAMGDAVADANDLELFMDPEENALVKSFRAAGGKGLAGTIESLSFDFFENITWETAPGHRAPQFLRVNMTFSPVHDISPGLDHNGYNRAPVYPVGYQAPADDGLKKNK